ncbi:MAG: 3-isopropylmalate dehydrogenase, partial [Candidatus Hydrogenedentes bacterium]|nr:3-isopropylmalate dehydrogenase [Candidatus Hydrogenedentota bacterium]
MATVYTIALLEGDGIGPELAQEAVKVLRAVEKISDARFDILEGDFGGAAYFKHGQSFPDATKQICD